MKDLSIACAHENKGTIDSVDLIRVIEGKSSSYLKIIAERSIQK